MKQFKILSIDAWASDQPKSWDWNNWFTVGYIDTIPNTNRGILKMMREEGYLSDKSKGKVLIDDDQYNLVICERSNNRPLFAIEYGSHV